MKKRLVFTLLQLCVCMGLMAKSYTVTSPNGKLKVQVEVGNTLSYQLLMGQSVLVSPSTLSMKT